MTNYHSLLPTVHRVEVLRKTEKETERNSKHVRVHLRPGTYHVLVLTELRWICGIGAQGDRSLLNALSRKCYMHTLWYVHGGLYLEQKMRRKLSSHFAQVLLYITNG